MYNFPSEIKIGTRLVGLNHPTFFIAEIGANFDGDLEKAKRLALAAKECGADCAKFQTFQSEKIVSARGFARMKLKGVHGSWDKPVDQVFKAAEFPREWHVELANYCKKIGIIFSSAAYDKEGIDLLDQLDVPFIKIGSGEITWLEALEYTAKKNRPLMLGTGAAPLSEVDEAVRTIAATGNRNLILLQCITNYPSKIASANINVLKTYQSAFGCITGYSDHTPGDVVPLGSVALGGRVIEKHFTLSRQDKGPDHPHSMEPQEFKAMIGRVRDLEAALGSSSKFVVEEESETVIVQRRGLYVARDIKKGERLNPADITVLRPALGIPPKHRADVVGCAAQRDLKAGDPLMWDDI